MRWASTHERGGELKHSLGQLLRHRFSRFVMVGVLNTAFGYGCFALLVWLGLHYSIALFAATVIGVAFNFATTGRIVFNSTDNRLLGRFIAVYAVTYTVNVCGIKALASTGLSAYAAGALMLAPVAVISYFLNNRFVFFHD